MTIRQLCTSNNQATSPQPCSRMFQLNYISCLITTPLMLLLTILQMPYSPKYLLFIMSQTSKVALLLMISALSMVLMAWLSSAIIHLVFSTLQLMLESIVLKHWYFWLVQLPYWVQLQSNSTNLIKLTVFYMWVTLLLSQFITLEWTWTQLVMLLVFISTPWDPLSPH
jgi:hypothetical protein